jgi:hypothetical protein
LISFRPRRGVQGEVNAVVVQGRAAAGVVGGREAGHRLQGSILQSFVSAEYILDKFSKF